MTNRLGPVFQKVKDGIKSLDARLTRVMPGHHRFRGAGQPVSMYCVYRNKNAGFVRRLIDGLPAGSQVALHRLDIEECPGLAAHTKSSGPGLRMELLQALHDGSPPLPGAAVLITDDDAAFVGAGLDRFLAIAAAAGFDIAQPAHDVDSVTSHNLNKFRPFTTARRTMFVEVGPVVFLSVAAQAMVFPFPAEARMGWGVDIQWATFGKEGLTLGVVDGVPMRHFGALAADYVPEEEIALYRAFREKMGYASVYEFLKEIPPRWRPWQKRPPWQQ